MWMFPEWYEVAGSVMFCLAVLFGLMYMMRTW